VKMTKELAIKAATLSNLQLSDAQAIKMASQLSKILDRIEILITQDFKDIKPDHDENALINVMRPDIIG